MKNVRWEEAYVPALGRLAYTCRAPSLEGAQGIYAAGLSEATSLEDDCGLFLTLYTPLDHADRGG